MIARSIDGAGHNTKLGGKAMILKADRIITGDGRTVLENKAVYIDGEVIADIDDVGALRARYPKAEFREYKGSILPGLIDMHAHIGSWWDREDAAKFNDFVIAFFAADYVRRALAKGVTTIRDVASPKCLCASIRYAVERGFMIAPRIISTDASICSTGGHSWQCRGGVIEADGPWGVRTEIRNAVKRGAEWIKLVTSHRTNTAEFTQEELEAAVDESHRLGRKIAVHSGTQPSIQMCIDAGFDTIEHGTYLTVAQAKQMAAKGIVWVPTIVAYTKTYEKQLEMIRNGRGDAVKDHAYFRDAAKTYKENFRKLYETGVKIVTGTDVVYHDAPVTPVASEMRYMVEYGMPAIEVIRAATKSGAETLDLDEITGEIAVGKQADILIVGGNPVEDIGAMEEVVEVYFGGKLVG
jgi:imidazolonepropionase-like amidohydrolase